jgi:predicted O-methyltransferase YrrM
VAKLGKALTSLVNRGEQAPKGEAVGAPTGAPAVNILEAPADETATYLFEVDDVRFCFTYFVESTAEQFSIRKPLSLVEQYVAVVSKARPKTIFELGIAAGGSTALLALLTQPRKLVAVELEVEPVEGLADFIDRRGLGDSVRPYYGVDQADTERLAAIANDEFGDEPLDLVIDDASHYLVETRASFEVLFPRVKPGGLYIIEDWPAVHRFAHAIASAQKPDSPGHQTLQTEVSERLAPEKPPRPQPLTRLAIELMLARATSGDAVEEISLDGHWITVRRGQAELDPETFQLRDLYKDHFGLTRVQRLF